MSDELTPIQSRIIKAAETLENEEIRKLVFQHGIMCQVGLPRSKQAERVFERSFKNASLRVEAGSIWNGSKWIEQPIPYGAKPRVALCYINTEAITKKDPEIDIGRSYADFCDRLGFSKGGSAFASLKKQMNALAACKMSFGFTQPDGKIITQKGVEPIERFEAWLSRDNKQPSLWPSRLLLGQKYMESLIEHAIPLPFEAIAALSHSALALDLLAFFARRLHTLERPVRVPFFLLKEQFGQEYNGLDPLKDFKKKFLLELKQVKAIYPAAQIDQITGGMLFKPSPPLVKGPRKLPRIPAKKIPLPEIRAAGWEIKEETLTAFRVLCPRLDVYACKADFDSWLLTKEEPKDYQKAFLGFAKKWGKGKG